VIVIALALLLTTVHAPALARDAAPATAQTRKALDRQEAKDRKVVEKALRATSAAQMEAMVPDLRKVVDNAPPAWPMIERAPGLTVVRLNDPANNLMVLLVAAGAAEAAEKANGGQAGGRVETALNTYGLAAFLLGSRAIEMRQPEEALAWLDRGLAFQPDNLRLVNEKGAALLLQRRFADALALYDAQPPQDALAKAAEPDVEARLLRARGFVLIELVRLDEAEAAYKAALALEPDHGGAKAELAYIRKLRAGGPKQAVEIFTADQAKARKPD
jgi:tetratricopeptide (TPR) repeat protein